MISPTNIVIIRPGASSLASFKYNVKKCSGLKSTLELNGFEVEFRPDTELAPTAIAIYKVDEIKSRSTGEVKEVPTKINETTFDLVNDVKLRKEELRRLVLCVKDETKPKGIKAKKFGGNKSMSTL